MQQFRYLLSLTWLIIPQIAFGQPNNNNVQLTTTSNNFMSLVAGFTARMQCSLYRCTTKGQSYPSINVMWYKDDLMLFNGTEFIPSSGIEPSNIVLQKSITPEATSNIADQCATEEYVLLLKNISKSDAGEYRCQLMNLSQQLDFRLDVLESGLSAGFQSRYTYDYTECCVEKGLTPICRSMCKPKDMHLDFFDPTSCKTDDYRNFLHCATDGGKRNYVPCCRQRSVPSFCYDFCSNGFQMLKRTHRLCLYYLPEIFECFNMQHALYPPQTPANLRVKSDTNSQDIKLCWKSAATYPLKDEDVNYSVHVKEVPEVVLSGKATILNDESPAEDSTIHNNNLSARRRMNKRSPTSMVVMSQESGLDKNTRFINVDPKSIEWGPKSDICVAWNKVMKDNRATSSSGKAVHYVAYVQASNSYGASEPSQPLYVTAPSTTPETRNIRH
ncbi:DB module domain-containing protein [Ditylenchus destructor]|nr:DB module domain-containing protein [Ditylenchus destructor]